MLLHQMLLRRAVHAHSLSESTDQQFVLDLLRDQHVLVVQGSGFNWPQPDHLRIVTLPRADDLTEAIGRIGAFLAEYRPD